MTLGERAAKVMGGWKAGMVEESGAVVACVYRGDVVTWVTDGDHATDLMNIEEDGTPDLSSPATQGCLFADVQVQRNLSELAAVHLIADIMASRACRYAEALVLALEGAT